MDKQKDNRRDMYCQLRCIYVVYVYIIYIYILYICQHLSLPHAQIAFFEQVWKITIDKSNYCLYVYIHTCTHTHSHTYIYCCICIYSHTHTHIYIFIFIHLYTYTCLDVYIYIHTHIHEYVHVSVFSRLLGKSDSNKTDRAATRSQRFRFGNSCSTNLSRHV